MALNMVNTLLPYLNQLYRFISKAPPDDPRASWPLMEEIK